MDSEVAIEPAQDLAVETKVARMNPMLPARARATARVGDDVAGHGVESYVIGLTAQQIDVYQELVEQLQSELNNPNSKLTLDERNGIRDRIICAGKVITKGAEAMIKASALRIQRRKEARKNRSFAPGATVISVSPMPEPTQAAS